MTIKARRRAKFHAKLRNELTAELKEACSGARKELAVKLKDSSLIELGLALEAKLRNEPTTELLKFAVKLELSLQRS